MTQSKWSRHELPDGRIDVIDLMPDEVAVTGREILGVMSAHHFIVISPDPKMGEVYKSGWKGEDLFSFTDVALRKVLNAGGVTEISYDSRKTEQRIWYGKYTGKYMRPDGNVIELSQDYEFDTTVGGPRWLVSKESHIRSAVCKIANAKYLDDDVYIEKWLALSDVQKEKITEVAEFKASRFVEQAAQYGRQRAGTGSINRAIRKFFVIRQYTKQELTNCCFHITSTYIDAEVRRIGMGAVESKVLELTEAVGDKLSMDALSEIALLVAQNASQKQNASQPGAGAFLDLDDGAIEGEVEEVDPEEAKLFLIQAEQDTKGAVMQAMIHFYGWAIFNYQVAGNRCQGLFQKKFSDLSEGEMQLLLMSYQKLNQTRGDTPYSEIRNAKAGELSEKKKELSDQATDLADRIRVCARERRLWRENAEVADQPGLEGLEDAIEGESTEVTKEAASDGTDNGDSDNE